MKALALLLLLPCAAFAQDLTSEYQAAYARGSLSAEDAAFLRAHKVLLVNGFLSNYFPGGFDDQMRWLKSAGISFEKVKINSQDTPDHNGERVAAAVSASPKPVIIFSHSKGCLDTLHALAGRPDVAKKVDGWVAIQGPFMGTPLADALASEQKLDPGDSKKMWGAVGGTPDSVKSMTTADTMNYYATNMAAVTTLSSLVPALSFTSWTDAGTGGPLEFTRQYLLDKGQQNDGMVPVDSQMLPAAPFVRVHGVGHSDPITTGSGYDTIRFTKAALTVLLRHRPTPPLDPAAVSRQ